MTSCPISVTAEDSRQTCYPIQRQDIWEFVKLQQRSYWVTEEVNVSSDKADFDRLSPVAQHGIKRILAFFAASDVIVAVNLAERFKKDIPILEVGFFYDGQINMENIHCVSGDTLILTTEGHLRIDGLVGREVTVWNGESFVPVTIRQTSKFDVLNVVTLDNGLSLNCTAGHKWLLVDGKRVETKDLTSGDLLLPWNPPVCSEQIAREAAARVLDNLSTHFTQKSREIILDLQLVGISSALNDKGQLSLPENIKEYLLSFATDQPLVIGKQDVPTVRVLSVSKNVTINPTYCFNEPILHQGVFGGILTGQSEQYSILLDTIVTNVNERTMLLNAATTIPVVTKMTNWMNECINSRTPFAYRVLMMACVEGIFFSGCFAIIFWLKKRGVMPGLTQSNELISRDEGLHTRFALHLYNILSPENKLSDDEIARIFDMAVKIAIEFTNDCLPEPLPELNATLMERYLYFVADSHLSRIGIAPQYNIRECPLTYMENINMEGVTDFFARQVTNYSKPVQSDTHRVGSCEVYSDF